MVDGHAIPDISILLDGLLGSESKPKNPELKFNGARIINTKSSLEDKSEGRYSAKTISEIMGESSRTIQSTTKYSEW